MLVFPGSGVGVVGTVGVGGSGAGVGVVGTVGVGVSGGVPVLVLVFLVVLLVLWVL